MVNWTIKNIEKALEAVRNGLMTQRKAAFTNCENINSITTNNLSSSRCSESRFSKVSYHVKSSLNINPEHVINQ